VRLHWTRAIVQGLEAKGQRLEARG
jgi:hypothetical protein